MDQTAPETPKPSRWTRRNLLLAGTGAALALVVAFFAGIPFGGAEEHEVEAHEAAPAVEGVFPPRLETEAHTETAAPKEETAKPVATPAATEPVSGASSAARFAAAMELEVRDGDEAARRLRALVSETAAEHTTLRRVLLLSLAGLERRLGHDNAADAVSAAADREAAPLQGAELLELARGCLAAGAPQVARRVLARFSLAASDCSASDLSGLITVCRLQAEACEAEWRRTAKPVGLQEPAITFTGAGQ